VTGQVALRTLPPSNTVITTYCDRHDDDTLVTVRVLRDCHIDKHTRRRLYFIKAAHMVAYNRGAYNHSPTRQMRVKFRFGE
jgi:hypothetical protein